MLSLDTAQLGAVLDAYPQVARAALTAIAGRLRDAQDRAHRLSAATAEQRVAATLLLLADRLGIHRGDLLVINAPLTRDELAGLAGLAPETASRILAQLRRDGAIDTGRRWVAVRDRAALEALATS
jgi:CRP/FNR family transcriptional regulator